MPNQIVIRKKINKFNEKIVVSGDKSISIRWVLFASIASGISKARNLLISEDVLAAINIVRKFGIKVVKKKNTHIVFGKGVNGYNYKKNTVIDAKNSATLGRLILGLLVNSTQKIKLIGDSSLSKRDFRRVTDPLTKFGAKFKLQNNFTLPLTINGTRNLKPINYNEVRGSAQCKSSVILAGMRTTGKTIIKAKKSRNHTELLCKFLKLPLRIIKKKRYDIIEINKVKKINNLNYDIPSDISSAAFFIVLTALSNESKIMIKKVNINSSRSGIITILKMMGVKIFLKNKKIYKGEKIADIYVEGSKNLKRINCPTHLNSSAIDEFLVIFLVAAKARGVSYFKNLGELNKKESPRLKLASKILKKMGIKNILTSNSVKIFGNPNLTINKTIVINNFKKDHRIFMTSTIAALSFGGKWIIHDKDSINTSFPSFMKIIKKLKNEK